jgi:hypothetical protein
MVQIGWPIRLLILLSVQVCSAQTKTDYTWILGYNYSGAVDGGFDGAAEGSIIDFNTSPPSIISHPIAYSMSSINVISHAVTGKLQFYTNGCSIINADHEVMDNGADINLNDYHDVYCTLGEESFHSTFNGLVTLPFPGKTDEYVLIHRLKSLIKEPRFPTMLYSTIDMKKNSGKGAVITKNVILRDGLELGGGYQTACKHANGRDWWVVVWAEYVNVCYTFLLDPSGISYHHSQKIGNIGPDGIGQAVFSPDGSRYVWYDIVNGVHVFRFDRETGMFSDHQALTVNAYYQYGVGGVTISPNSRFAYLSAQDTLYQLDLWEKNLYDGLEVIDTILYITPFGIKLNFSRSMLAPDCRIYISTGFTWETLHIIHHPDEKGKACGLEKMAVTLPFPNSNSALPNMPHYRMDETQVCDPTITSLFPISWYRHQTRLYPNPVGDYLDVEISEPATLMFYDITGQIQMSTGLATSGRVDISALGRGIYVVRCVSKDGQKSIHKLIKQ